ncbi:MAG: exogenous ferric siderophore receptor, partial [Pseudomonadota bacterium]
YDKEASEPSFTSFTDPAGTRHDRATGFGGGGKTVDNTNRSLGASLDWNINAKQRLSLDVDSYRQEYDNSPLPDGTFPLGTVDSINTIWRQGGVCEGFKPTSGGNQAAKCAAGGGTWHARAEPRAGYAKEQEFTRDTWALTHNGDWDFGHSLVSLSYVSTNNNGRTLPFTVAERQQLLQMMQGAGSYATMTVDERKALAEATFLPRAKRVMESEQYVLDTKLDMPFELLGQHTAVLGSQITRGKLNDGVFGREVGSANKAQDHNMWSVFAEDTWFIVQPFALTAGVRYDNHEVFGDAVSPRLYGVYNINHNWTVKGGVSTGFKTPNTTDLYEGVVGFGGQGTMPFFGNPDLKPETSTSSELALYWQADAGHGFNLTLFQNTFKDKISGQPCGPTTAYVCASTGDYATLNYANSSKTVNIDEVQLQGAEVAGRLQLLDSLALRANYTYTDSEQKSGANEGQPYGNIAKHMANSTLDWQMLDSFGLFLTVEYRDRRFRSWDAVADKALYYKAYEVLHLGFNYQILENLRLSGRINNLLDQDFTGFKPVFNDANNDGDYLDTHEISYLDDYNNKDKRRNYWLSLNLAF